MMNNYLLGRFEVGGKVVLSGAIDPVWKNPHLLGDNSLLIPDCTWQDNVVAWSQAAKFPWIFIHDRPMRLTNQAVSQLIIDTWITMRMIFTKSLIPSLASFYTIGIEPQSQIFYHTQRIKVLDVMMIRNLLGLIQQNNQGLINFKPVNLIKNRPYLANPELPRPINLTPLNMAHLLWLLE